MVALNAEITTEVTVDADMAAADAPIVELTVEEKKEKITTLFSEGKRDYIAGSFETAADKLGEAAKFSVEVYGEKSGESFDSHFYYGKTLLEIGRAEDEVLKNAMKDMPINEEDEEEDEAEEGTNEGNKIEVENPDDLTDAERAEIKEVVEEALEENAEEIEKEQQAKTEGSGDGNVEMKDSETAKEDNAESAVATEDVDEMNESTATAILNESAESTVTAIAPEEGDELNESTQTAIGIDEDGEMNESQQEEPTTIQLAWETLEAARLICDNQEKSADWELKKASVLVCLAECSIEDENFKQAIDDLNTCVELQLKHQCDGRVLAQTYFLLARTFKLDNEFTAAADFYTKARDAIVGKIEKHESLLANSSIVEGDASVTEDKEVVQKEIDDLKSLIPDMNMKIEDAIASAKQLEQSKDALLSMLSGDAPSIPAVPADDKPVAAIEVRKAVKRPAPETESGETEEPKKLKEDGCESTPSESVTATA